MGCAHYIAVIATNPRSRSARPSKTAARSHHFPVRPNMRSPAPELGERAMRTIAKILSATKSIFLSRGYRGTTIDEITRVAGVSRASFYTYFPTKRDALLALGGDAIRASRAIVDQLRWAADDWSDADLEAFVDSWFDMEDESAGFAFAWTQAAHEDDEIREAGMKTHLRLCRELGLTLGLLRGEPFEDPTALGLVVNSMLERGWSYAELYAGTVDEADIRRTLTQALASIVRRPGGTTPEPA
jgi:AcrR family transcriptional regulator